MRDHSETASGGGRFTRREVIRCGAALGGLSLPFVLRLRAAAAGSADDRSTTESAVIFVSLGGGASHLETYDPKPDAPAEYRGSIPAIRTSVPGVQISALLPEQARIFEKLSVVRSVQHGQASHIALHIIETGYDLQNSANARAGEMPSVGAVVSRVWADRGRDADGRDGERNRDESAGLPASVSLPRPFAYSGAHWLGAEHNYFIVNDDPNAEDFRVQNLALLDAVSTQRLEDRRRLLDGFDQARRLVDLDGYAASLDAFSRQAFDLMTGPAARRAFDVGREDPRLRERYGRNEFGQRLLLARRLVEEGVPFVHVRMADWDDHQDLFTRMQARCPKYDRGIAALVEDLEQRGLRERVLVVALGEFGRTPRINVNSGRDHWPAVMSVLLSGGRYASGHIVGASDSTGARVIEAPYAPQNVLAMVYRHLGIDPALTFPDYAGRPRYVLEERRPITELL
jgi:hypothetical protein